jgi:xylulokinase
MRDRRAVVGIDLGTSGVKVLVVSLNDPAPDPHFPAPDARRSVPDAQQVTVPHSQLAVPDAPLATPDARVAVPDAGALGRVLGRGRAEYPVLVPSARRAESNPADWWQSTCRAVRQALAQARDADIVAVAIAGQMHGVVLTAASVQPPSPPSPAPPPPDPPPAATSDPDPWPAVRPAILWLDQRAALEADRYAELPASLVNGLGNRPSPGMAGPILCWLARHEPEHVAAAQWALQPKDWIRLQMTGQAATDPTDASGTLLYDLKRDAWADDLIAALGLPRDKLPPVRGSAQPSGALLPGPAAELGLPPGIPVATGAADTAAALYAADLQADEAMLTLGSGGQWAVPETGFRPTAATNLYRAVGDGYYRLAPVQNVGVTLNWVRTLLDVSWADLYDTARRPARPNAPVFVPYLTPERWDPAATGSWTGLTLAHQQQDLLRSALDGVAALLSERLHDLQAAGHHPRGLILGGGGAAHPAWRAQLADTLALPLRPVPTAWLTATGAARLAAAAAPTSPPNDPPSPAQPPLPPAPLTSRQPPLPARPANVPL